MAYRILLETSCPTCGYVGKLHDVQSSDPFATITCPTCQGVGKAIKPVDLREMADLLKPFIFSNRMEEEVLALLRDHQWNKRQDAIAERAHSEFNFDPNQ